MVRPGVSAVVGGGKMDPVKRIGRTDDTTPLEG